MTEVKPKCFGHYAAVLQGLPCDLKPCPGGPDIESECILVYREEVAIPRIEKEQNKTWFLTQNKKGDPTK